MLRQPPFSPWLEEDREFLLWRERLSQARADFDADKRARLAGRELEIARGWMQTRAEHEIEPADQAFIRESIVKDDERRAEEAEQARAKEIAEREEQERRVRDAERIAAEQKKAAAAGKRTAQVAVVGSVVALLLAVGAITAALFGFRQKGEAEKAASEAYVSLTHNSDAGGNDAQALAYLAQALRLNHRNYAAAELTGALLTQTGWPLPVAARLQH